MDSEYVREHRRQIDTSPSYDILVRLNVPIMQGALLTSRRRIARMSLITRDVAVPVPT